MKTFESQIEILGIFDFWFKTLGDSKLGSQRIMVKIFEVGKPTLFAESSIVLSSVVWEVYIWLHVNGRTNNFHYFMACIQKNVFHFKVPKKWK